MKIDKTILRKKDNAMNQFIPLLQQRFSSISTVEKRIARVILDDPQQIIGMTVTQLASKAGTSAGSVANFAVTFGFKGFTDMKLSLARQLQPSVAFTFDDVLPQDDPKAAMQKMIANAGRSFDSTLAAMRDEMRRAADILLSASLINIYASGSSLPVMYDIHYRLLRLGLPVCLSPESMLACLSASQLNEHSAVIAVSHKGRTENTLKPVSIAKERGAKIISLTSVSDSPLTRISDVNLISVSYESAEDKEAVVTRLTQLLIFDSICAWIAAQRSDDALTRLDTEIELLELYRTNESPKANS